MNIDYKETLKSCAAIAQSILIQLTESEVDEHELIANSNKLQHMKNDLIGENLFLDRDFMTQYIPDGEEFVNDSVNLINLATFAFCFRSGLEYQTCTNIFFKYVVPFDTYTTEEIDLYFGLKLSLFRDKVYKEPTKCRDFISEVFTLNSELLYLNPKAVEWHEAILAEEQKLVDLLNGKTDDELANKSQVDVKEIDENLTQYIKYRLVQMSIKTYEDGNSGLNGTIDHEEDEDELYHTPHTEPEYQPNEFSSDEDVYELPGAIHHEIISLDSDSEKDNDNDNESSEVETKQEGMPILRKRKGASLMLPQDDAHVLTAEEAGFADEPRRNFSRLMSVNSSTNTNDASVEEDQLADDSDDESYVQPAAMNVDNDTNDTDEDVAQQVRVQVSHEADETDYTQSDVQSSTLGTDEIIIQLKKIDRKMDGLSAKMRELVEHRQTLEKELKKRELDEIHDRTDSSFIRAMKQRDTYVTQSGKRRKIPKARAGPIKRWTEEELQALEAALALKGKKRSWAEIAGEPPFKGQRTPTQIKDKAENEVIRRKREGIPLGGFKYGESNKTKRILGE